jgi:hypothetical protein
MTGLQSSAIYSRGKNKLTIFGTDFNNGLISKSSGALLDIEGAELVEIINSNFFNNEGAPILRAANTNIKILNG